MRPKIDWRIQDRVRDESGAILALVAICMVVLLGISGLALDSGRGFLTKARLSRAVDAGALTAARALRQGESVATNRALAVAAANGLIDGKDGVSIDISFGTNAFGEQTVRMEATRQMPTLLMRVLGQETMNVASSAVAAVPPVDLVLVLDQSGSMEDAHAWDDLQDAAREFVSYFDDSLDQLGLTSFQLRGTERFFLSGDFTQPIRSQINAMDAGGDTNPGEGLRLALEQMTSGAVRERSAKVIVLFTDGRPTAFRDIIGGEDRMLAVYMTEQGEVRGFFDDPETLPTDGLSSPDGCKGEGVCFGWTESEARAEARAKGFQAAEQIRSAGIFIYAIGLGNPNWGPMRTPDMDYLRLLANEEGVTDPDQPAGKTYFAPSAAELREVFNQVAQDLLVRLAQ